MCFPDVYEVGMSHLGSKILYCADQRQKRRLVRASLCALGGYGRRHAESERPAFFKREPDAA
jgi:hypothetical protein